MMMRRAFFACLLISLTCTPAMAPAGVKFSASDFTNLLQSGSDEHHEPPRRLRALRLKEAIRKGDLSPDEARDWRRNKQRQPQERSTSESRQPQGGRSHWRETQRRALENDD